MIASLPMYDLAELRAATDTLWSAIARHLGEAPVALDRARSPEETWADPTLLFSQTCGYPLTHAFRDRLRVIATPVYAGGAPGTYASVIVVAADAPFTKLADLSGTVAAINDRTSHSGSNALLAATAESFFSELRISGSHEASLGMVAHGEVAVAAIDRVTHTLLARCRPSALAGTRVLARTNAAPAPPYVTRGNATDDEVAALRRALGSALTDPTTETARAALLLEGMIVVQNDAYEAIVAIEQEITRL